MAKTGCFFQVKDALYEVVRATLNHGFFKKRGEEWVRCEGNKKGSVTLEEIDKKDENSKVWTSQETDVQHKKSFQKSYLWLNVSNFWVEFLNIGRLPLLQ